MDNPIESRTDWTRDEIERLYARPLLELIFEAGSVHRKCHNPNQVQICNLLSIKTGGCSEDCKYCPQSAKYNTAVEPHTVMPLEKVIEAAKQAKAGGASRFCMGAAWREVRDNRHFDQILEMVRSVKSVGLEVCCTLGMVDESQAKRLKEAGLDAYNHNLDTSREYYGEIISTRTYDERLQTLENVRKAGVTVCCGGIVGMGESEADRIGLLHTLATLPKHPESVPINALVPVKGTPLETATQVSSFEFLRMVAVARILMPHSKVRLSAGRESMSKETQALCFLAGANSIFSGDKLLTTPNPSFIEDEALFAQLGLVPESADQSSDKFAVNA
jgi:biotin synthase